MNVMHVLYKVAALTLVAFVLKFHIIDIAEISLNRRNTKFTGKSAVGLLYCKKFVLTLNSNSL